MLRVRIGTWVLTLISRRRLPISKRPAQSLYTAGARMGSSRLPRERLLRHSGSAMGENLAKVTRYDVGKEPFRIFFPAGVLAGIVGVALWPLHFSGWVSNYPGQAHVRL